jgi:flagellar basal-body rod protein FlgG
MEIGRIELARFTNPTGLLSPARTSTETPASGEPALGFPQEEGMGRLVQGALESNVEIVQEMVDMITSMRAYEINSKSIRNSEQMSEIANALVR